MSAWDFVLGANSVTAPFYWGSKAAGAIGDQVNKGTDRLIEDKAGHAGEGFGRGAVRGAHDELRSIIGDYARQGADLLKGDEGSLRRTIFDAVSQLRGDR